MTQHEYDAIIKCINIGAPALANELITSLNNVLIKLDVAKCINTNQTTETNENQTDTEGEE